MAGIKAEAAWVIFICPFQFLVQSISEALCTPQFGGVFQKQEEEQTEEISEERHSVERGVPSLREPRKQS